VSSGKSCKSLEEFGVFVLQTMPLINNLKAAKYRITISNNRKSILMTVGQRQVRFSNTKN
jgi:hypothetical protein